jgi:addiction module HigA family antidote
MSMKNPSHPGTLVREFCLNDLNLTVTEAAAALGVSRLTLSKIINGKSGISADMAIRLAQVFGSTPDTWLRMQLSYDLAQAEQRNAGLHLRRLTACEAPSQP